MLLIRNVKLVSSNRKKKGFKPGRKMRETAEKS
jgi:hypothetical protein